MKVLTLNPPFTKSFCRGSRWQASPRGVSLWPPIWLAYATGVLEQENEVKLIDGPARKKSLEELKQEILNFNPELIAIYTSTASINNDIAAAETLKGWLPKTKICMTGPHVSVLPEWTLKKSKSIDYVARKEFDQTLKELAKGEDTKKIKGLSYWSCGRIVHNKDREYISNLDEIPFVSKVFKKHLNYKDYKIDFLLYPFVDIYTGRGCFYRCTFCAWPQTLMGRNYRTRNIDNIIEEIKYIKNEFPDAKEILFDDDTFTTNRNRVKELCERFIKEKLNITWTVNVRPDILDLDLLKLMKKAGCRSFVVGYESGSQEILNNIRKGTRIDNMIKFTELCKKAGIKIHGDFIVGLPGESWETVNKTLEFAKKLNLTTIQCSIAHPLPGTEFYNWLKEKNYLLTEDFSEWVDENGQQKCIIKYPNMGEKEFQKAVYTILSKYYLRPKYFLNAIITIIKEPREFMKYYYDGKKFLKYITEQSKKT